MSDTLPIPLDIADELTYSEMYESIARDWPEYDLTVVEREQIDTRRWYSVHRLTIRDAEGNYWQTTYERGLTEMQEDHEPFGYGVDPVPFYRVVPVEKIVTVTEYVKA